MTGAEQARFERLAEQNVKLRYLCLVGIPALQEKALLPRERGVDRLEYLLRAVDLRAARELAE